MISTKYGLVNYIKISINILTWIDCAKKMDDVDPFHNLLRILICWYRQVQVIYVERHKQCNIISIHVIYS